MRAPLGRDAVVGDRSPDLQRRNRLRSVASPSCDRGIPKQPHVRSRSALLSLLGAQTARMNRSHGPIRLSDGDDVALTGLFVKEKAITAATGVVIRHRAAVPWQTAALDASSI